ncbi:MAG: TonB-dependent receptor plug domain-containing protein, partial [Cyclonatronaceae bacterium]
MLFAWVGIFIGFSQAEAQQARVYGQITEVDGSPVVGASISIENTTLGSSSDVEGRYELTGLDAGRYTLLFRSLGYEPEQQDISLDDAEQLELNVTLEPQEYAMQQVEVLGRRERSYKNNSTFSLSRTEMRVSELPQSVSFVTKELIEDQNAYRLNDVLGNIAGANTFSTYDDITIRGFRNSGNVRLLNGMRYVSNFWTSPLLVNIERVEVVKGPSSVTFGNASPGGTINLVTKKPLNRDRAALSFSFGSFNRLRTTADLTGPLGDEGRLLYRLNVGYEDSESFRDQMFYKTLAIAPSLSYVPNEGTRLNIDLSYYDNNTLLDRGRPTLRNDEDLLSVPVELNVAQPGDVLNPETFAATLSLNHQFSDRLDFNVNLSRFKEERVLKEHRTNNSYLSDSEIGLAYVHRTTQSVAENLSSFFTLRFETGALQHQVIAGADYARYDETRNQLSNGSVGSFDLLNPENRLRDISSYDLQPAFS